MCHQSVGLVQGAIEAAGMSTISISVRPEVTINMLVPRAVYVRFPTGNPVGEPYKPYQQRVILEGVLQALEAITDPGTVLEMPYRWKRMPEVSGNRADAESGDQGKNSTVGSVAGEASFEAALALVQRIEHDYVELMRAVDAYRSWLEAEIEAENGKAERDEAKVQALAPQLRYLSELQDELEGRAHDGLVRVSDRVVRIKHWQDGAFI
jgi:D-proline reductase (dithiol) PrdB